jgi:hypothetical protein
VSGIEEGQTVRRGLEKLLESVDIEIAHMELRLKSLAEKFGLKSLEDLERMFREGPDNPEVDLAWPEYQYLKGRLMELRRGREEILKQLKQVHERLLHDSPRL